MALNNLWGIFYQMGHIWWAPSWLKKSPRLKVRSHLSHTLFHSFSWPCRYDLCNRIHFWGNLKKFLISDFFSANIGLHIAKSWCIARHVSHNWPSKELLKLDWLLVLQNIYKTVFVTYGPTWSFWQKSSVLLLHMCFLNQELGMRCCPYCC